eukprot:UN12441
MATLHIISCSATQNGALESCLRLVKRGNGIILIQDAIYQARARTPNNEKLLSAMTDTPVYVLLPDAQARGISAEQLLPEATRVDYEGFVELTCEYETTYR